MKRPIRFFALALVLLALIFPSAAVPQIKAQGDSKPLTWKAFFFNNETLSDPTVLKRDYIGPLALYWGTASPGPEVNADNFSARFATDVFLPAGDYRFYVQADDAVNVIVDFNNRILQNFDAPKPNQFLSADLKLKAGNHHIQIDYREVTGNAYIYFAWANLAEDSTPPVFPVPQAVVIPAWTAQYYNNPNLAGNPTLLLTEPSPSHDWGLGSPGPGIPNDGFSARWSAAPFMKKGAYQLIVRADDGVRVTVGGNPVLNEWHGANGQTYNVTFNVPADSTQPILVEYYDFTDKAFLDFELLKIPDPKPTFSGTTGTVNTDTLRVRSGPSTDDEILTLIKRGETIELLGRDESSTWFKVRLADNTEGWVVARYIKTSTPIESLPVVAVVG